MPLVSHPLLISYLLVLLSGLIWGVTFSLARIATEAGAHPLGLTFWQGAGGGCVLLAFCIVRFLAAGSDSKARNFVQPGMRYHLKAAIPSVFLIAIVGNALPGALLFYAAPHVPAGVLAITIALVPLLTYAASLCLKIDHFSLTRVSGVALGFLAILLVMLPQASLPGEKTQLWLVLALLASFFYTAENIYVDRVVPASTDITFLLMAAMFCSALILLPITLHQNAFVSITLPLDTVDIAVLVMMLVSSIAYLMYLYLIRTAGAVFASMSGYIVTLAGVFWGMLFFNEKHTTWIWSALILMLLGMLLVTPRQISKTDDAL